MSTPAVADPIPVPSFSTTGWTTSLSEKADLVASHFFLTDAYQSNLYMGKLVSLQALIQQYGQSDVVPLITNVRQTMEDYLRRYYPEGSSVTITSNGTDPTYAGSLLTLNITALITLGGVQYSFGWLVSAENSIVNTIVRINNTGPAF